jgi:hypothetical protein
MSREGYGDGAHVQKVVISDSAILALALAMSFVSMSFAIFCLFQIDKMSDGHRIDLAKVESSQRQELYELKKEHRLVDNDWQQMNAFLERQGVVKDANGFYILKK